MIGEAVFSEAAFAFPLTISGSLTGSVLPGLVLVVAGASLSSKAVAGTEATVEELFTALFLVVDDTVDLLALTATSTSPFAVVVVDGEDFLAPVLLPPMDLPRVFSCCKGDATVSTSTITLLSVTGDTAFLGGRPRFLIVATSADIEFTACLFRVCRY